MEDFQGAWGYAFLYGTHGANISSCPSYSVSKPPLTSEKHLSVFYTTPTSSRCIALGHSPAQHEFALVTIPPSHQFEMEIGPHSPPSRSKDDVARRRRCYAVGLTRERRTKGLEALLSGSPIRGLCMVSWSFPWTFSHVISRQGRRVFPTTAAIYAR